MRNWRRGSGRSASPFSKEQRKADPRKPGRKPGQGPFLRRAEPEAGTRDKVTLAAAVESRCCPDCGGALEAEPTEVATVIDLPEKPRLVVQATKWKCAGVASAAGKSGAGTPGCRPIGTARQRIAGDRG